MGSCSSFSPLGGGMTASARTALERSAAFAKASCGSDTSRSRICNRHGWPAARSAPWSRMGEEAATPGQPVALTRSLGSPPGNSPSRITGCRWLCRNHSASSGTFTFRCKHFQPDRCASQDKNLASLCRNCGGHIFPVEDGGKLRSNISTIFCPLRISIIYTQLNSLGITMTLHPSPKVFEPTGIAVTT